MGMNFRPLHDRVVVKRLDEEEKTAGGIILPNQDVDRDGGWYGTIVSVGPGRYNSDGEFVRPTVEPGQRVLVAGYNPGHPMGHAFEKSAPDDYVSVCEEDLICVIEDEHPSFVLTTDGLDAETISLIRSRMTELEAKITTQKSQSNR